MGERKIGLPDLACLLLFVAGILTPTCGRIHRYQNTDTILNILNSLDLWTPFYWTQSRIGMLLPLLARPFRDPVWNLVIQTGLNIGALYGSFLLMDLLFSENSRQALRHHLSRASIALLLFLPSFVLETRSANLLYQSGHPYAVWLFLTLAALVLLIANVGTFTLRYAAFSALLWTSLWVNEGGALYTGLLFLGISLWRARRSWRHGLIASAALFPPLLISYFLVRLWASRYADPLPLTFAPWENLPDGLLHMWDLVLDSFLFRPVVYGIVAAAVCLAVYRLFARRRESSFPVFALILCWTSSVIAAIFITHSAWVEGNLYDPRYWTGSVLLIMLPACVFLAHNIYEPLYRLASPTLRAWVLPAVLCAAMIAGNVIKFGPPGPAVVRASLAEMWEKNDVSLRSLDCTHFIGDVWQTWPASFYWRTKPSAHPLWAISSRSEATISLWSQIPSQERNYCSVCGDPDVPLWLRTFDLPPLAPVRKSGNICLLGPR